VTFDIVSGLQPTALPPERCDIRLSSEALEYVIKYEWGRGTLAINGRFQANYETLWRFFSQTAIGYANNIGLSYPNSLFTEAITSPSTFVLDMMSDEDAPPN